MSGLVYYNEFDPYAAQWLKNLIAAGHLPAGDVDTRDIREVSASDLEGYTSAHWFAGIGGWPLALRLAGWEDSRPVWTGSCPCQPLSSAGQRKGHADERHLWPAFHALIAERRPAVVFGEQVSGKDGREWLAGVRADMEATGYALGAADICAASAGEKAKGRFSYEDNSFVWKEIIIGAPHIRQRLWWVADAADIRRGKSEHERSGLQSRGSADSRRGVEPGGMRPRLGSPTSRLAESDQGQRGRLADRQGRQRDGQAGSRAQGGAERPRGDGPARGVGDAPSQGRKGQPHRFLGATDQGLWSAAEWLPCSDGKARRVEPGSFPLAHGIPNRVGRLRAYGNAIVPQVAAEFIAAYLEA